MYFICDFPSRVNEFRFWLNKENYAGTASYQSLALAREHVETGHAPSLQCPEVWGIKNLICFFKNTFIKLWENLIFKERP